MAGTSTSRPTRRRVRELHPRPGFRELQGLKFAEHQEPSPVPGDAFGPGGVSSRERTFSGTRLVPAKKAGIRRTLLKLFSNNMAAFLQL